MQIVWVTFVNTTLNQLLFSMNLKDVVQLIRLPNLMIVALAQYACRLFLIGPLSEWETILSDWEMLVLVVSTLAIGSAGYIINDYYDVKVDIINRPEKVVIGRTIRRRVAMAAHQLLNIVGIGLGMLVSMEVAWVNFWAVFLLWLYSNQLKRLPLIGNMAVSGLTAMAIWVVAVYTENHSNMVYLFASFAFFISLMRQMIKDMEDLRGDMHFGSRTLPIVWGIRKTKSLMYLMLATFMGITFVLLQWIGHWKLTAYFLIMLLPTGYFIYKLYWADTRKTYHHLNQFCKFVMLSGIFAMIIA